MEVKSYPRSYSAEESLLGAILLEGKSVYEKVSPWIRVDDAFYKQENQKIWQTISCCNLLKVKV